MDNSQKKSILFRIGLGKKSGKLICGTDAVCDGVRYGNVILALCASDASDNSMKRIKNCATYYNKELIILEGITTDELGAAIGKSSVACVGVTDENIVKLIKSYKK